MYIQTLAIILILLMTNPKLVSRKQIKQIDMHESWVHDISAAASRRAGTTYWIMPWVKPPQNGFKHVTFIGNQNLILATRDTNIHPPERPTPTHHYRRDQRLGCDLMECWRNQLSSPAQGRLATARQLTVTLFLPYFNLYFQLLGPTTPKIYLFLFGCLENFKNQRIHVVGS